MAIRKETDEALQKLNQTEEYVIRSKYFEDKHNLEIMGILNLQNIDTTAGT